MGSILLILSDIPAISWWQQKLGIYPYSQHEEAKADGRRLFQKWCQNCHDREFFLNLKRFNKQHFFMPDYYQVITYGGDRMPSFKSRLGSSERWKIVNYILSP